MKAEGEPEPASALARRLGYGFANPALLAQALTHRSYTNEHASAAANETLAVLGDAVLSLLAIEALWPTEASASAGALTRRRAAVVTDVHLARCAAAIGVGDAVRLGHGEAASGGAHKPSVLASALEAVVGAAYLDGGLPAARRVVASMGVW